MLAMIVAGLCSIGPSMAEDATTPSRPAAASAIGGPQSKMPVQRDWDLAQGCPASHPYACPGGSVCCAIASTNYCRGYTGSHPPYRSLGTFCVTPGSNEDWADLRSNCALFVSC